MTAQTFTDRTAPAPWGVCDVCSGPVAALPSLNGSEHHCPACAVKAARYEAAEAHLYRLALPVLTAWASYWAAAGLSVPDLQSITESFTGDWANETHRTRYQGVMLQRLSRQPLPQVEAAPPDRFTLDPAALPRLTAAVTDLEGGRPGVPYFQTAQPDGTPGRYPVTLPRGCDAVLILPASPEADGVLYFTGLGGSTAPRFTLDPAAYRVPPRLLPAVREALGYWAAPYASPRDCPECEGRGVLDVYTPDGPPECPVCDGTGTPAPAALGVYLAAQAERRAASTPLKPSHPAAADPQGVTHD